MPLYMFCPMCEWANIIVGDDKEKVLDEVMANYTRHYLDYHVTIPRPLIRETVNARF